MGGFLRNSEQRQDECVCWSITGAVSLPSGCKEIKEGIMLHLKFLQAEINLQNMERKSSHLTSLR